MRGRPIVYSAAQMTWLKDNRLLPITDYHRAFLAAFGGDVTAQNLHALRKRMGWKTGRTGHFAKGQEPPNKGKTMPFHPNSAATRFKPGSRTGRAAENYKSIGTIRISQDGYQEIKIHDGLPMQSRWRLLHLVQWEKVHGPIPEGQCLKCLDGDRMNTDAANWQLIPRGVLARLNGGRHKRRLAFDAAPAEVKPVLMTMAQIEHRAHTLKRKARA
ncbi:MAG: hypothetical protein Q8S03_10340 [Brevundimonas sp.]|uniref:hypothetical protein n=1 Tax=Brevundimonas sp. TaxID=1871086 RepID=UPI0027346821|nr:hypothetical protein [Brevundimonas sp.]MDP3405078.1 hypothetical protein [Brevundimonas sp.]